MHEQLSSELKSIISFEQIRQVETIQSLWSGYGSLLRVWLQDARHESVVVKRISSPGIQNHPRGWHSDIGHERKLKSYLIEQHWYEHYNQFTNKNCRTAAFLGSRDFDTHSLLVLEDLDQAGFNQRKGWLSNLEIKSCLSWLAHFHGQFMLNDAEGLWPIGTYWQFETRPLEWKAMPEGALKAKAKVIHEQLNKAKYQTIVHGDAKYANFCFSTTGEVAAVDFQYVGKGCGIKDVVYLLSCIDGGIESNKQLEEYLTHYFNELEQTLPKAMKSDFNEIEKEWRALYPFAWADFERFLAGWAPGHWKLSKHAHEQTQIALNGLI